MGHTRTAPDPGLHIHRSNRLELLADELSEKLARDPVFDPLQPVEMLIGSRGMERYLRAALAEKLGICANVAFRFLEPMLVRIEHALGIEWSSDCSCSPESWGPDRLGWALLEAMHACAKNDDFAETWRSVCRSGAAAAIIDRQQIAFARRMAELIDRYLHDRPDWFLSEANTGATLEGWQRTLFDHVETRLGRSHFPARLARIAQSLRAGRAIDGLHALHVFGLSRLAPAVIDLLVGLSERIRVHAYLLTATPGYLGDLVTLRERPGFDASDIDEALRASSEAHDPLLVSLGRVSRNTQILLLAKGDSAEEHERFEDPLETGGPTVLRTLQSDLLHNEPTLRAKAEIVDGDRSIGIHACHGPARQAEVLREALLHVFRQDPTIQPRDVVVMTPDLATYAPIVQAVFAQGRKHAHSSVGDAWGPRGAPQIPVEIADLGIAQTNPCAELILALLQLADGRLTASAFDRLLSIHPVQERFQLEAADIDRFRGWLRTAGIRWAEDEDDRAESEQPRDRQNTFGFGLDRLALGVTQADDRTVWVDALGCEHLPIDDMEGEDRDCFGRFAELVRTVASERKKLREPRSLTAWSLVLEDTLDALTETSPKATWLKAQVRDVLADLQESAALLAPSVLVSADAIRTVLEGTMESSTKGDRVATGAVTVCALQPMRSVPYRVVALLGLDDDVFPRRSDRPSFDLMAARPRVGDRDPREEDRHLFLEAFLSARDHFMVFYTGRDVRTNERLAPATPVAELLEAIRARGITRADDAVHHEHALAPFSPQNFEKRRVDGSLDTPWSFDRGMFEALLATRRERSSPTRLFSESDTLPEPEDGIREVTLASLEYFLDNPAKQLLKARLGLHFDSHEDEHLLDREPIELGTLELWKLADELLRVRLRAEAEEKDPDEAQDLSVRQARAEGRLPLGAAAEDDLFRQQTRANVVLEVSRSLREQPRGPIPVTLELGEVSLTGTVEDVHGDSLLYATVAQVDNKPKHLLTAWVRLLAAQAASPGRSIEACLFGAVTGDGGYKEDEARLCVPGDSSRARAEFAAEALRELVELYREGMTRPLPLFRKSSFAFAKSLFDHGTRWQEASATVRRSALAATLVEWGDTDEDEMPTERSSPDNRDPYISAVFGRDPPFEGRDSSVAKEFVCLAEKLWWPVLEAKQSGKEAASEAAKPTASKSKRRAQK